ncbi:MAG: hypothetical protein U0528_06770 [Anaerolineae bacterium]
MRATALRAFVDQVLRYARGEHVVTPIAANALVDPLSGARSRCWC